MKFPPWTAQELDTLKALYPNNTAKAVSRIMGRSPGSVHRKAIQLGIGKSPEFLASDKSGRIQRGKTDPRLTATHWKPGDTPWNKGQRYRPGGRSEQTQFKPGDKPATTLPVGMYRLCSGQLQRKTSETPGPNYKRWTPVTRLVWESVHGPVPPGHIVVFRPGRATAELALITPDALDCISRAEHARRNHPSSKSPELAKLCQLRGAITRQVNRIIKEAKADKS